MTDVEYIIVKYADQFYPNGYAPETASVGGTYSARECGIDAMKYADRTEAEHDLILLREFNPTIDYGIVKVETGEVNESKFYKEEKIMQKPRIEYVGFPIHYWLVTYKNISKWFLNLPEAIDYVYANGKIPVYQYIPVE